MWRWSLDVNPLNLSQAPDRLLSALQPGSGSIGQAIRRIPYPSPPSNNLHLEYSAHSGVVAEIDYSLTRLLLTVGWTWGSRGASTGSSWPGITLKYEHYQRHTDESFTTSHAQPKRKRDERQEEEGKGWKGREEGRLTRRCLTSDSDGRKTLETCRVTFLLRFF